MPAVPPLLVCLGRGRLKLLPLLLDCAEKTEKKIQNIFFDNTYFLLILLLKTVVSLSFKFLRTKNVIANCCGLLNHKALCNEGSGT